MSADSKTPPSDQPIPVEHLTILRIDGFVRPLNVVSLREKMDEFGVVEQFWMNKVRSYAVVTVNIPFQTPLT